MYIVYLYINSYGPETINMAPTTVKRWRCVCIYCILYNIGIPRSVQHGSRWLATSNNYVIILLIARDSNATRSTVVGLNIFGKSIKIKQCKTHYNNMLDIIVEMVIIIPADFFFQTVFLNLWIRKSKIKDLPTRMTLTLFKYIIFIFSPGYSMLPPNPTTIADNNLLYVTGKRRRINWIRMCLL